MIEAGRRPAIWRMTEFTIVVGRNVVRVLALRGRTIVAVEAVRRDS